MPYQLHDTATTSINADHIDATATAVDSDDDDDVRHNYYFRRRPTSFMMKGSWGQASDGQPRYTWTPANAASALQIESVRLVFMHIQVVPCIIRFAEQLITPLSVSEISLDFWDECTKIKACLHIMSYRLERVCVYVC